MNTIIFILLMIAPLILGFVGFVLYGILSVIAAVSVLVAGLVRRLLADFRGEKTYS